MADANSRHEPESAADHGFASDLLQIALANRVLLGLALASMVLLEFFGDGARRVLSYDRAQVLNGEGWRLLTGHWVHGGWQHMFLNVFGAALMIFLFARCYNRRDWLLVIIASVAAIDAGFLAYEPCLKNYVGASGVLHGVLAAGAVAWWRTEPKWMSAILTAIGVGKLMWEQTSGALPLSGGLNVIVDAHMYGALGGLVAGLAIAACDLYKRSDQRSASL